LRREERGVYTDGPAQARGAGMTDPDYNPADRPSPGAVLAEQMSDAAARRARARNIRPLGRLWPYLARHRVSALFAGLWLIASTAASLTLTVTARGAIDNGFEAGGAELNFWFLVLGANAVALGLATALRYFFVTRTGERVIADLRQALFGRVLRLDPSFFAHMRTGEVLSRLTTDVLLVETLLTTSVSYALRHALTVASQDRFAGAVGFAGESVDAIETVQAFGRQDSAIARFATAVEDAFAVSLKRIRARALMTAMIIVVMFGGVTLVLWLGARDVIAGSMSAGALLQFVLLSVFAAGAVGALGESWGDVQKAAGAMERIDELMRAEPAIAPPPRPAALPE